MRQVNFIYCGASLAITAHSNLCDISSPLDRDLAQEAGYGAPVSTIIREKQDAARLETVMKYQMSRSQLCRADLSHSPSSTTGNLCFPNSVMLWFRQPFCVSERRHSVFESIVDNILV